MPKSKPRKRKKQLKDNENPRTQFLKRIFRGSLISAGFFFLLLFILALFVVKFGLSDSTQNIFVFFFAVFSVFAGSFAALHKTQEKGLISGTLCAVPAILLVCIILLIFMHKLGFKTAIMSLLMLLGGALGGIAAVNK